MPNGTLGGGTLAGNNQEQIGYSCVAPALAAGFTVSFCNKTTVPARVRLSIGPGPDSTAAGTVFLEYAGLVTFDRPLERTGLACAAGKKVIVSSDVPGVDYAIYGFEKQ